MGEHDYRGSRVNVEVEELNGGADEGGNDDFIARVYRNVFLFVVECGGGCLHSIFLFFGERTAILRTAKATFQSVTKRDFAQIMVKKGIMFRPAISRL